MGKILVSIISEHLIPNLHLCKHLEGQLAAHLLITTRKMMDGGQVRYYYEALGNEMPIEQLEIHPDNYQMITEVLGAYLSNHPGDYLVNLTGGTKMISIAAFEVFSKINASMYYVAIGTNSCRRIYPTQGMTEPFRHTLSLKEYLGLYGYEIEASNTLLKPVKETKKLFETIQSRQYNALSVSRVREAFMKASKLLTAEDEYYRGLWFEEYMYHLIKEKLELKNTQLALNVKVRKYKQKGLNDNEFDVMFVHKNKLYVIECKSSLGAKQEYKANMEKYLYKQRASVNAFGLQVNPILAVCSSHPERKNENSSVNDRAKILSIRIIDAIEFDNPLLLNGLIKLL